jgi:hypothetical protein
VTAKSKTRCSIENSTTGSVAGPRSASPRTGPHHRRTPVEVRHALLGLHGAALEGIKGEVTPRRWPKRGDPHSLGGSGAAHDTAGAVRQIAEQDDPTCCLAPERVAESYGLTVLLRTWSIVSQHDPVRGPRTWPPTDRRRRRQDDCCVHDRPYPERWLAHRIGLRAPT